MGSTSEHDGQPLLLSVPAAARRLSISARALWRIISTGEIKPLKVGQRCTRVKASDLDAYIDRLALDKNPARTAA